MQVLKKDFCTLSKISIDHISNERITELFTIYNNSEIYVLDNKQLVGLITRGDYLKSLSLKEIKFNKNYKFLIESDNTLDEAKEILYKFKNINSIPVINNNNELLYSYTADHKDYLNNNEFKWIADDYTGRFMQILDIHNFNPPLSEYFRLNNFNNIFIFGNDYLCNTISVELSNIADINIIGVLTITDIKNGISSKQELLKNIYKANLLLMADFRYFEEYKLMFDDINIMKISLHDILMSYDILADTPRLFKGISKLQKNLLDQNRNVSFYSFSFPKSHQIKNSTNNEKNLIGEELNNKEALIKPDGSNTYYDEGLFPNIPQIKRGNLVIHSDFRSDYVNIVNRTRITTDVPENYKNSIYMFGSSAVFGWGSEDKYTIASCLQRLVNQNCPNRYQVINCGVNSMWNKGVLKYVNSMEFQDGDIVIFINIFQDAMVKKYTSKYNIMDNLQPLFDRPHNLGEVFVDSLHSNWIANQEIAKKMFETCIQDTDRKNTLNIDNLETLDNIEASYQVHNNLLGSELFGDNPEYLKYIEFLKQEKVDVKGKIGTVAVNCNPLTLGHKYIIEEAASRVDFLYIFVAEEENPHFSFKDRFMLVKKATAHLKNVKVLTSGKFFGSTISFPEYFRKDIENNIAVNPSLDVESFAKYIAPTLGITVRFVGDEPTDYITRQYNNAMKSTLPKYNIDFVILKRKEFNSEAISASRVRKLIQENDFETIKSIVPDVTYEYLVKRFLQ